MAKIGRLAGAFLCETQNTFYLVGNLKEPCDFAACGFEKPSDEIDALQRPFVRLTATRSITLSAPVLKVELEGEALAKTVSERLVIQRNGSASERLWRVLVHGQENAAEIEARWLTEVPSHVWQIVRETVFKC